MTEVDSEIVKPEMLKACVWLRTSDDSIQQVEQEVAMLCPFICHEIHSGMGSSKNYPISLPSRVNPGMLSLILDYCHFHQVPGHSNKERKSFDEKFVRMDTKRLCELTSAADSLQLKPLVDLTSRALARVIEGKTPEQIREIFHLPDDLTENVEVEEEHADERSVDDLLSFINGDNEDCKGTRNSKHKKKNRRRKELQKSASVNCTRTSSSTSFTCNDVDVNDTDSHELNSACRNLMTHSDSLPTHFNATKLRDIEEDRSSPDIEFDDCDIDDGIDPALKEKIDREVEDFARRLNSDWPERMQQILSLGQGRIPLPLEINGNGSLRSHQSATATIIQVHLISKQNLAKKYFGHFFVQVSVTVPGHFKIKEDQWFSNSNPVSEEVMHDLHAHRTPRDLEHVTKNTNFEVHGQVSAFREIKTSMF